MGYRIFVICLKQLFVKWKIALRLSWFWTLVTVSVWVVVFTALFNSLEDGGDNQISGLSGFLFTLSWFGIFFTTMAGLASIAIGWHRYVLQGEMPRSPYVFPAPKTFWPYVGRGFKSGLKVGIVMIPIMMIIGSVMAFVMVSLWRGVDPMQISSAVSGSLFVASVITSLLLVTLYTWFTMRLGLGLPGTAIGQDIRSSASWKMTGPISGALFTASLLVSALMIIPSLLAALIAVIFLIQTGDLVERMLSGSDLFWNLLPVPIYLGFYIISFFVGFGILTVIYGHLQEDKPI
ncbi:hypothetical protein [Pararhizobium sp. IMCC21322]|uniref:hypothetical protein n=1 Tax=Pararhizobium sp. IMCC21322 TaxID=3067903 RepID=UPI0027414652|nr:hypothetical protein [Pararhizobium sp. IMCC21322]